LSATWPQVQMLGLVDDAHAAACDLLGDPIGPEAREHPRRRRGRRQGRLRSRTRPRRALVRQRGRLRAQRPAKERRRPLPPPAGVGTTRRLTRYPSTSRGGKLMVRCEAYIFGDNPTPARGPATAIPVAASGYWYSRPSPPRQRPVSEQVDVQVPTPSSPQDAGSLAQRRPARGAAASIARQTYDVRGWAKKLPKNNPSMRARAP